MLIKSYRRILRSPATKEKSIHIKQGDNWDLPRAFVNPNSHIHNMSEQCTRFQVVLLGNGSVGKSSILKHYLSGTFSEVYRETVEETYIQAYNINGDQMTIDFIDTAGSIAFPAMRNVYIKNANGFILVYSINNAASFEEVKSLWNNIKQTRSNVEGIPCVIVGSKVDLESKRQVESFDALEWAYNENLGGCYVEASSLDSHGINDIFDVLLEQMGNTRARQNGPFRVRSSDQLFIPASVLDRKFSDTYIETRTKATRFQDLTFEIYKEKTITMIQRSHKVGRSSSICDNSRRTAPNLRRRASLPFDRICCVNDGMMKAGKLEDIDRSKKQNGSKKEQSRSKFFNIAWIYLKIRQKFRNSK